VLATVARPHRATALLVGAAAVVGVHALEFPMTSDRTNDAAVGSGTWFAIAACVAFLAAAGVALAGPAPHEEPEAEPEPAKKPERNTGRPVGKRGRRA
jgi:hypothetical protein